PDDPPDTEVSIVPIMLWSDSTHLTNFGNASLWPIYMYFGSMSKYTRGKPTASASHHLAYMPSVNVYKELFGCAATSDVLRFCKHELTEAIWKLLLNPEFMHTYEHGILEHCGDGILRRLFPRFFTYSADYSEKILLACIRYLAQCPCPRCLIRKSDISEMGTPTDSRRHENVRVDSPAIQDTIRRARGLVFKKGTSLNSKHLANILDTKSLVTTRSAFSTKLSKFGFNHYSMFVPDLMHEFELGVWKAILTHLMRILYVEGNDSIQIFNQRNVSAMKQLAARDFEDILQVLIDLLLPQEHNEVVLDMLWNLCSWHALAKLRLHMEEMLVIFTQATEALGDSIRVFVATTCEAYLTQELPKEHAARGRRAAALCQGATTVGTGKKKAKGKGKGKAVAEDTADVEKLERKIKKLNLSTYKFHALGDYVQAIRQFGTTDNYTTQIVRSRLLRHIANEEETRRLVLQRQRLHGDMVSSNKQGEASASPISGAAAVKITTDVPIASRTSPYEHYHMSNYTPVWKDLHLWLKAHKDDRAFDNFLPSLKDHLLVRLLGRSWEGDEHNFTREDQDTVKILENKIYFHK
ncbi:hypothetical protein WOLCODRAFT_51266, partial [Wolfiporia cocos MD-104 SS10]